MSYDNLRHPNFTTLSDEDFVNIEVSKSEKPTRIGVVEGCWTVDYTGLLEELKQEKEDG